MNYRLLGDTGVYVSEICLGAMTFGGGTGFWKTIGGLDQPAVDRIVHRALDAGVNFIDTADVYAAGESETMVGRAIADRRHRLVIATKVRGRMGRGPNEVGLSRLHIVEAVDASLRRLGTDYIDLYQIHRPDNLTNVEDTMRALDDVVRAGKVRYVGCSNVPAWQMMKALAISREQHLERFRCTQSYYSLLGRDLEREIIPLLRDQRLGLLVWSPLAGGFLSGKFTRQAKDAAARRATFDFPPIDKERAYDVVELLQAMAQRHNATVARIALAWVLSRDVVSSVIIGARSEQQLEDNLQAGDVTLSTEELQQLDTATRLAPEYPHWMELIPGDRLPHELSRYE